MKLKKIKPDTGQMTGLLGSAKIKDIKAYFIIHYEACILASLSEITLT